MLRPERPSPHLNLAVYPPTVWTPHPSNSPPPLSSVTPVWRQIAHQWWKEQLLKVRRKWELRQRSLCSNILEGKRETVLSVARICAEASVPFTAPTPKHAQLMDTTISIVESCSMNANAPHPPSSPPCPTSSTTYPQPWEELVRQMKNPTPVMQPRRPRKRRQSDHKGWKRIIEDGTEVHTGEEMDRRRGRGGNQG